MPDITISIASYNTKDLLQNCLDSIYRYSEGLLFEVIVVDNASQDGSPEMVRECFPSVILVRNSRNVGFGQAHNQAFQISSGRYFLILNSDTELHAGTLRKMTDFMDLHKDAGIAGCKTFLDADKTFLFPKHPVPSIWNYMVLYTDICGRFPKCPICFKFWNKSYLLWNASNPTMVDGIDGGAMTIRRETFTETGGFDRNFFMFFEENDLFLRTTKKAWSIYYLPQASVSHYHAGSHKNQKIGEIAFRSKRYYFLKHYGSVGWVLARVLDILWRNSLSLMRRLRPSPDRLTTNIYEFFETEGRLEIPIPKSKEGYKHIMELSTNWTFSPRAGVYVDDNVFVFTRAMLRRFVADSFYWRLISVSKEGRLKDIVETGRVLIHRDGVPKI